MHRSLAVLACIVVGCGGGDETGETAPTEEPPPGACAAGEWLGEDGACIPAGLPPDMPCAPGEWLRGAECIPAGVPPDGCAPGFVHDGDRGCDAILPRAPCPPGSMAVPGERSCHEVAPCAPGTWGDIPVEPDTQYVDASYVGMDSDGSALKPWITIQAAVAAAAMDAIVAIAAGSYLEDVFVAGKSVRLWGVCPTLVEVVGAGVEVAAIRVFEGASGTEMRGIAVRSNENGVFVNGSLDVGLERVWVHDNAQRGVVAQNDIDATSIWMRDTLVALNHEVAIFSSGSTVTIDTSVVHTTQPNAQGIGGRGLSVQAADTVPSTLLVRSSVLDRNHDVAVFAAGSEATLEASVVRATQPTRETSSGRGVAVQSSSATRAPSALSIGTSVIEQNHGVGVYVEGSEATVDASVVRTTEPDAHGVGGVGLAVQADSTTGAPSTLIFKSSLVDDNREQGVIIVGSDVTIEGAMIRRTRLNTQGEFGRGASVQASSSLLLRTSVIEQSYNSGLFVVGSEATVEASVVRLVEPNAGVRGYGVHAQREGAASKLTMRASLIEQTRTGVLLDSSEAHVETSVIRATDLDGQGFFGRGVQVQSDMLGPSTLVIDRSAIEKSHEAAVFVIDSVATIDSCRLAESVPNAFDALGDGVVVMAAEDSASTSIIATRVDRAALAAVATWGAYVSVSGSAFTCQAIDVATETYLGRAATLEDLGGNLCGCPDATESCKALSANLQPPTALEPD